LALPLANLTGPKECYDHQARSIDDRDARMVDITYLRIGCVCYDLFARQLAGFQPVGQH
jgi:hypothetical protein